MDRVMTPKIYNLDQIKSGLEDLDPIQSIEDGFVVYSKGKVTVPSTDLRPDRSCCPGYPDFCGCL